MENNYYNKQKEIFTKENANLLKSANLKTTKKRLFLIDCLKNSDGPLTAEEIHRKLREDININLSTVYRALSSLSEAHIIIRQVLSDGNSVFQLNSDKHRHILTCKECGKISYVDVCPIDSVHEELEDSTGYDIISHNLEFIGICPDCKNKK